MPERFVLSDQRLSAWAANWELAQLVVALDGDGVYIGVPRIETIAGCLVGHWRPIDGGRVLIAGSGTIGTHLRLILSPSERGLQGTLFRDSDDLRRPTETLAELSFAKKLPIDPEAAPITATRSTPTGPHRGVRPRGDRERDLRRPGPKPSRGSGLGLHNVPAMNRRNVSRSIILFTIALFGAWGCAHSTAALQGTEAASADKFLGCYAIDRYCGRGVPSIPGRLVLTREKLSRFAEHWETARVVVAFLGDTAYVVKPRMDVLGGCLVGYWLPRPEGGVYVLWARGMAAVRLVLREKDSGFEGEVFQGASDDLKTPEAWAKVELVRVACTPQENEAPQPPTREECGDFVAP
jgi:hypothetical protein